MKAHNRPIYHCLFCGHVIVTEPVALAPFCCGREMIRAAEESCDDEAEVAVSSKDVEHSTRFDPRRTTKDRRPVLMRRETSLT